MRLSDNVDHLTVEALALELEERAELADRLLASLDEESVSLSPAWPLELRRRRAEVDNGEVERIPTDVALAQLRANIA
jgi:putative addiction module component (TIGR02574 family)